MQSLIPELKNQWFLFTETEIPWGYRGNGGTVCSLHSAFQKCKHTFGFSLEFPFDFSLQPALVL